MTYKPGPKCTVRDGRFIQPCAGLLALIDGRRVQHQRLVHLPTGEPTRTIVSLHSGEYAENGLAMNCCPVCGERIDAPHTYSHEAAALNDAPSASAERVREQIGRAASEMEPCQ